MGRTGRIIDQESVRGEEIRQRIIDYTKNAKDVVIIGAEKVATPGARKSIMQVIHSQPSRRDSRGSIFNRPSDMVSVKNSNFAAFSLYDNVRIDAENEMTEAIEQ